MEENRSVEQTRLISKPKIVVTRKLPEPIETRMMELFDARLNLEDIPLTRDELLMAVQTAEILIPTVTDNIDSEIINSAGNQLRMIANFGVGVASTLSTKALHSLHSTIAI